MTVFLAVITELGLNLHFLSSEPDDPLCSDLQLFPLFFSLIMFLEHCGNALQGIFYTFI